MPIARDSVALLLSLPALTITTFAQEGGAGTTSTPQPPAEATPTPPSAAEPGLPPARTPVPWTVRVEPNVWWVSPSGDLVMPRSSGTMSGGSVTLDALNIDTPEFTPAGHLDIHAGDLRFSFFGGAFSRDASAQMTEPIQLGDLSLSAGDEVDTQFDFNIYELTVGYRFYSYDWGARSANKEKTVDLVGDFYALAGGRLYDFDIDIERADAAASTSTDQFFGDALLGARAEFTFLNDFNINVQLDAGGMTDSDRTSFSFNVQLMGEWRPWENVGVEIGWRHTFYDFEDGDGAGKFSYDGSMAGMFAGVVIRF